MLTLMCPVTSIKGGEDEPQDQGRLLRQPEEAKFEGVYVW